MTRSNAAQRTGLLLVGHGTRDDVGTGQFFQLAEVLAHQVAPTPVQPCLLELQSPTIEQGWHLLVSQGVTHVHVAPLLLFSAGHAKQDIPEAVAAVATQTPGVSFDFSRPLSRHAAVVALAAERILAVLAKVHGSDAEPPVALPLAGSTKRPHAMHVVMVGRGSFDPCARSDMYVLSEIIGHKLRKSNLCQADIRMATCFYAMAEPRLPDVLEQVCQCSDASTVIVYSHLLFEGRLYQAIKQQVAEVEQRYPHVRMLVCDYLGPHPWIAQAVWERAVGKGLVRSGVAEECRSGITMPLESARMVP